MTRYDPVLVTGAAGFVGSCAVRRLLQEEREVHVLLRPGASLWRLAGVEGRVQAHTADLRDASAVATAVADASPRTILHFGTYGAYESQADARCSLETDILGSYNLLEAGLRARVLLFVNAGSSSEYGYKSSPMSETDRLEPSSVYAVAKAAQTHLCSLLAREVDAAIVTFRLFSVFGPWEEPTRLIPRLIGRARARLPLELVSPETARDFVYVDDVLDAMLSLDRLASLSGEVVNLGSGRQTALREVVDTVEEVLGVICEKRWGTMPARRWDTASWEADVSKAGRLLGWSPKHSLRSGLARMAAWMADVGDDYGEASRVAAR